MYKRDKIMIFGGSNIHNTRPNTALDGTMYSLALKIRFIFVRMWSAVIPYMDIPWDFLMP